MGQAVERREIGLGWALAMAVALHAIALFLSVFLPIFEFVAPLPQIEDRITFSLIEPTTDELRPDSAPPAPSMPSPSVTPVPPMPDADPGEPTTEAAAYDEPRFEPEPDQPIVADPVRDVPVEIDAPAPPPVAEAGEAAPEPDEPGLDAGADAARPRSLRGALREFESALRAAPPRTPPAEPSRPSNVFVPDMSQVPVSGSQLGELTFESRDYDWSEYGRQIYMAIWRAWHRRLHASADEFERWAHAAGRWYLDDQSGVRFVIERSGRVVGIEVEYPGRCEPLDRSAADALAEVVLPPLPADFPRDREVVHARFLIRGEVRSMRPVLRRMKAMGLF